MGRISSEGMVANVDGSVGNITVSSWKGKRVMRRKSGKRTSAVTQRQLIQQAKFKLGIGFTRKMRRFLEISYRQVAKGMSGQNKAMSEVLAKAITGSYPTFAIDFSK